MKKTSESNWKNTIDNILIYNLYILIIGSILLTISFTLSVNGNSNLYNLFQSWEKVKSVANRIAIFNSAKLHKAVSCTDEKRRVVINFNYFTSKYGAYCQTEKAKKLFKQANAWWIPLGWEVST